MRSRTYPAPNGMTGLPTFFIVGPPRTGTTWLHEVLKDRAVLPSSIKETRFFDHHFHRGIDWYRAHYPTATTGRQMGEIAPTYFASNAARERIAKVIPEAQIVCVFRNPVERVLSLYRLKRAYGMIPWNFDQAVLLDPELLESGRYATKLKAWQEAFGLDQVLATLYDDLRDRPQTYMDRVSDFIGIARFELTEPQRAFVNGSESMTHPRNYNRTRSAVLAADWFKARRLGRLVARLKKSPLHKLFLGGGPPFAELSSEISHRICEIFRPEVEELETILNRDLSAWKNFSSPITSVPMGSSPMPSVPTTT
jgi:sulfotransferase family protein